MSDYQPEYCDVCGEELGGSSHYHCSNCGKESGMYGCARIGIDPSTGQVILTFSCIRPEWWQAYLDKGAEEVATRERARMNQVGEGDG